MTDSRDRHGRGLRGPLSLQNRLTRRPAPLALRITRSRYFLDCVEDSVDRVEAVCPDAIRGIEVGVEAVPTPAAMWQGMIDHDAIPLAGATGAAAGQPARLVLYERPIERRALDRDDLADLVHHTLVEQLASLTGRSALEIDPGFEDDW